MFDIIGGVGVLRDCMGRMGLEEGEGRSIQPYSVKYYYKAAILEKPL